MRLPERSTRNPPRPEDFKRPNQPFDAEKFATELREPLRKQDESRHGDYQEIRRAVVDRQREIEIVSTGDPDEEISIRHEFGFRPDRYQIVDQDSDYSLRRSRSGGTLGDEQFAYFKTKAPKGAIFRVILYSKDDSES